MNFADHYRRKQKGGLMRAVIQVTITFLFFGALLAAGPIWAAPSASVALNPGVPFRQADADAFNETLAALKSQPPTFADHFRSDDGHWEMENSETSERSYQLSTYRLNVLEPQTIAWSLGDLTVADFYLEVDAFHSAGPLDNEFGLLFRYVDKDNFYLYGASSDGYYTLQKLEDGEWIDLTPWTKSDLVNTGELAGNTLGIWAEGERITILLNGEVLETVEDDSFASGQVGLVVGTFDEGDAEIAFDDLMLWDLQEQPGPELTSQVTPEITAEATPEVTSEATPEAIDLSARLEEIRTDTPLVRDDFRRDENHWPVTSNSDMTYSIRNRAYQLLVKTANWLGFAFSEELEGQIITDFLVEVDVAHVSGPLNAEYGLLFHYQDGDNFYLYAISGIGTYSLWRKADGEWTTLIDWTESDLIDSEEDATNRLGLLVEDAQITLLINDQLLAQVEDEAPFSGTVGLIAGSFDEPNVTVAFDNFALWALSPVEAVQPPDDEPAPNAPLVPDAEAVAAQLSTIRANEPAFSDEFRRNTGIWEQPDYENVAFAFAGGAYRITVNAPNITPGSTGDIELTNFLVEVDASQRAGPEGQYGLFFRQQDERNFYFFAVTPRQTFSFWKMVNGAWTELIPWTEADAIAAGSSEVNRIGVLAEGSRITLLVNDTPVAQFEDESFANGKIALAAGSFAEGGVEVEFDNLDAWELE
jgi:hypothetical protein